MISLETLTRKKRNIIILKKISNLTTIPFCHGFGNYGLDLAIKIICLMKFQNFLNICLGIPICNKRQKSWWALFRIVSFFKKKLLDRDFF